MKDADIKEIKESALNTRLEEREEEEEEEKKRKMRGVESASEEQKLHQEQVRHSYKRKSVQNENYLRHLNEGQKQKQKR